MTMRLTIAVSALLLTAAAQPRQNDQTSVANQNARADQQAFEDDLSAAARLMRDNNMSAQGVSTVLAGMRSEQREQWRIFQAGSEQQHAINAAADAEPFNAATFEAALKRYRDNQSAAFQSALDAEIKIFRELSPQDQRVFAQLMHTSSTTRLGIPPRPVKGSH